MSLYRRIALAKIKDRAMLEQALDRLEIVHFEHARGIGITMRHKQRSKLTSRTAYMVERGPDDDRHFQLEGDFDYTGWAARDFANLILKAYVTIAAEELLAAKGFIPLNDWEMTPGEEIPFENGRNVQVARMMRVS